MDGAQNQAAYEKIRALESRTALPAGLSSGEDKGPPRPPPPPVFIQHVDDLECAEGTSAVFRCKVEPKNDPSLNVGKFRRTDRGR